MYKYWKSQKVYPEDIQCVFEEKNGNAIFVGNLEAAENLNTLKKNNIKAVLTAARSIHLSHQKSQIPYHLHVPGDDHEKFNLFPYFDESIRFIESSLKKTNILVHCMAGISRSVTLVIAYLLKNHKFSLKQAIVKLRKRRKIINPNPGFIRQLQQFEKLLQRQRQLEKKPSTNPLEEINRDLHRSWVGNEVRNKSKKYQQSYSIMETRTHPKEHYGRYEQLSNKKYETDKKKMDYQSYIQLNKQLDEKIAVIRQKYLDATNYIVDSSRGTKSKYSKNNTVTNESRRQLLNQNIPFSSASKNYSLLQSRYKPSKIHLEPSFKRHNMNYSFFDY